jgi:hypothetical protein
MPPLPAQPIDSLPLAIITLLPAVFITGLVVYMVTDRICEYLIDRWRARWKTRYEKIGYWISEDEWNRLLEEHPEIADWAKEAEEGD